MGSGGSKGYCGSASSSRSSPKTTARALFHSSCLGSRPSNSHHLDVCEDGNVDKQGKVECRGDKAKLQDSHDLIPNVEDEALADEWCHRGPAPNADADAQEASPPRFLSRFSFIPANVSFRLSRATSLGSSTQCHHDHTPDCLHSVPAGDTGSSNTRDRGDLHSPSMFPVVDGLDLRLSDRRINARYPVDRNVRFSRTLSVGRLRDRVLRRSSLSEHHTYCPLQHDREAMDSASALGCDVRNLESQSNAPTSLTSPSHPSAGNVTPSIRGDAEETSRSREARYHDLLEHRSNFLERRRRIRSQVHALQRLGSRFENLSGHERSCILSGQHRTGSCTCRAINRDASINDETSSTASISRIVMLAEALFEVLDEIHQQSVVLSSRPSVSSLGSVPAPKEVVESLPIRLYSKSRTYQNDETAQCYICLVEYEEGDSTRVLPCHHEFHSSCVDKWLKEIHRVCPLCRGDICQSDSLSVAS